MHGWWGILICTVCGKQTFLSAYAIHKQFKFPNNLTQHNTAHGGLFRSPTFILLKFWSVWTIGFGHLSHVTVRCFPWAYALLNYNFHCCTKQNGMIILIWCVHLSLNHKGNILSLLRSNGKDLGWKASRQVKVVSAWTWVWLFSIHVKLPGVIFLTFIFLQLYNYIQYFFSIKTCSSRKKQY